MSRGSHAGGPEPSVQGYFLDTSQAVERKPWGHHLRTFHQHSMIYSFEFDCLLPPGILFRLHGFPANLTLGRLSERQQLSLIGESWFLPSAATALYSFYLNEKGPWWQ